ncbi:hypothetical protein DH2020_036142 [Rehmannia glutinosa]|uniref:Ycf49-like protein n=1 Tax=Rehmannia glutinosa TaxID=99300 RepID=A0ABR0V712_REHGL
MGILDSLCPPKPIFLQKPKQAHLFNPGHSSKLHTFAAKRCNLTAKRPILTHSQQSSKAMTILIGAAGITLFSLVGPTHAADFPVLSEPSNALSLPTWAVHVSSVVEWATAMALVWQYGEKSGYESWKGLSWGMVPLLGGALCACTWHFFYNSESLELMIKKTMKRSDSLPRIELDNPKFAVSPGVQVLVALQAALTVIGNATMCIAAYRIYVSSQERSKNL